MRIANFKGVLGLTIFALGLISAPLPAAPTTAPADVLADFTRFANKHFTASADPLYYQFLGDKLQFAEAGQWIYPSVNSAAIACETSLPAQVVVDYGLTSAYGQQAGPADRKYFNHLRYLRNLEPGKTYHYRITATDSRGQKATSDDRTFTTATMDGAIAVPGNLKGQPYVLDQANARYVLTEDLRTPGAAIAVVADGVTLDLNGHTITFANDGATPARQNNGIIVARDPLSDVPAIVANVKVLNGTVIRGHAATMVEHKKSTFGFNNLSLGLKDGELAGVTVDYDDYTPQAWGGVIWNPEGKIDIHHNVFIDRGSKIGNRHGAGVRPLGITYKESPQSNDVTYRNNLVQRTRQNGLNHGQRFIGNEIYVDSFSTNSFAMQPQGTGARITGNRIFGTGFNPYAMGWASHDMKATHNFVHMHGADAKSRWHEDWGDISMCEGFRVTNYGKGGQERSDLEYANNCILIRGGEGSELRGTGFFSDVSIKNLTFHDNIVKVEALDAETISAACISTHGQPANADTALPVVYSNNTLISNICNIRWGDKYGRGQNHQVKNTKLVKSGDNPNYHTFNVEGTYWATNNKVIDCEFGPGTRYNDVMWTWTSEKSFYDVMWTLKVNAPAGSKLVITDATGLRVFEGKTDQDGTVAVPLTQARMSPPAKYKKQERNVGCREVAYTPHQVELTVNGKKTTVKADMTQQRTLQYGSTGLIEAK